MKNTYIDYMHTKMPFGKYKGIFIKDLPNEYLIWAVLNIQDRALAEMFKIEYQRRNKKDR